jgi:serine/threonine protein kinase
MPLCVGDKLGPYEILASIGVGGMGEVYRARDPRMGREVAIKVSAKWFSDRFEREVRAVAALNHPKICHLYDSYLLPTGCDIASYCQIGVLRNGTCASDIRLDSAHSARSTGKLPSQMNLPRAAILGAISLCQ